MFETQTLPVLDHDLAEDEIAWNRQVYQDFDAARAAAKGDPSFNPKEALREILARPAHQLPTPMDLTGPGPWRGGRNRHGRNVTAVFLPRIELHRHEKSRTDQFAIYIKGEATNFALDDAGKPVLTPVTGGGHYHNPPNAPHAFVPNPASNVPADWEIAFIAITPRNLKDDTQAVSAAVKAVYKQAIGVEAPAGV
jgi:hypothetical protein